MQPMHERVLAVVLALPMRDGPLRHELRQRAPEARPGGLALGERGRVALQIRVHRRAVVPWSGFFGVRRRRARRVLGLEA